MKQTIYLVAIYVLLFFCAGCSDQPAGKKDSNPTSVAPDILPDSLFAFKNIRNSLVTNYFQCDTSDNCYYQDSSKRIRLILLDSIQKRKYISSMPIFTQDWIMNDWQVRFVAKQDKIGMFTPIIVWAGGTDYAALILILLDTAYHPVSYFELSGGECGDDPSYCDVRHSFFSDDGIRSYVTRKIWRKDYSFSGYLDSVSYKTKILPNGQFETARTDSTRFKTKVTDP